MSDAAKIRRQQKEFLRAMKEKFAEDPAAANPGLQENVNNRVPMDPVTYTVIDCPICHGRGYHGPKRAFCHSCGSTGKKRVRT